MSIQSELTKLENLEDISIDVNATLEGRRAKDIFCNGWPSTKVVLEAITELIKNPIAKVVIGIVVKAGDALAARICSQ